MLKKIIKSPLVVSGDAILKEIIDTDKVIKMYQSQFNIDVNKYFGKIKKFGIYECANTKYRFYYPFNIDGDGEFYEKLQKFEWYYMPWKWENEITLKSVEKGDKILEVGSGGLGFLEKMQQKSFDITGLELNEQSVIKAKEKDLKVLNETIQEHSKNNTNKYDVVCSFQVLEHISDVHSFLKTQIDCLKKGGKLIISVPNNDSFIKLTDGGGLLNKPPHHMGLWDEKSLKKITKIFNLKVENIDFEPLQKYHFDWYINSIIKEKIYKNRFYRKVFNKFKLKNILIKIVKRFQYKIHGHSIMVTYTKL